MGISSTPEIIGEIQAGRMVVLVDEEDRENEGDLVMAAEFVTPQAINFMATHGRGLICVAMTGERADALDLPLMAEQNQDRFGTAFTVSVDAHPRFGVKKADTGPRKAAPPAKKRKVVQKPTKPKRTASRPKNDDDDWGNGARGMDIVIGGGGMRGFPGRSGGRGGQVGGYGGRGR